MKVTIESELVPIPQNVVSYYRMYYSTPNVCYGNTTIKEFLTEHGVKGEEYDNVVFVISKGWNQYQFETYAPMIKNGCLKDKEASYIRNRNLFYVCCSRPKKRLFFFISIPLDDVFHDFLCGLAGEQNILTYEQYISRDWRK